MRSISFLVAIVLIALAYTVSSAAINTWYVHLELVPDLVNWPVEQREKDYEAISGGIIQFCDAGFDGRTTTAVGSDQWGSILEYRTWFPTQPDTTKCTLSNVQAAWDLQVEGNIHKIDSLYVSSSSESFDPAICSGLTPDDAYYVNCFTVDDACPKCPIGRDCQTDEACDSGKCVDTKCANNAMMLYSYIALILSVAVTLLSFIF